MQKKSNEQFNSTLFNDFCLIIQIWKKIKKIILTFWALCLNAVMFMEEYTKTKKEHITREDAQNV